MTRTSIIQSLNLLEGQRVCDFFGYSNPSKVMYSSKWDEEDNDDDYYSPTSWEREPGESDEDYNDRMEDQDSLMDYFS